MTVYVVFAYFQGGIFKYRIASTRERAEEFKKNYKETYWGVCVQIQVKKIDE